MERPAFLTHADWGQLLANGRRAIGEERADLFPVVRLFIPDTGAIWLLSEVDPSHPNLAFGLCDLGLGCPELGYVCLGEISDTGEQLGRPVERDIGFKAEMPLSAYARSARHFGRAAA